MNASLNVLTYDLTTSSALPLSRSKVLINSGPGHDFYLQYLISINHLLIYVNNNNVYNSSSLILSYGKYQKLSFFCDSSFSFCPNLRGPGSNFHFNYSTLSKENRVQAARLQELGSRSGTFCLSVTLERSGHLGDVGIYRV